MRWRGFSTRLSKGASRFVWESQLGVGEEVFEGVAIGEGVDVSAVEFIY
jgi:hypothetical protein